MSDNQIFEKIKQFKSLLYEYNESTNIYSKKSYDMLDHHIQDSLNLSEIIQPSRVHVDLGSGSGLPGVIIAIATSSQVICVESKQKKRLFLNYVKEALDLSNLEVFDGDVQLFAKPPKLLSYLSLFKKHQYLRSAICWVPISEAQSNILKQFDDVILVSTRHKIKFEYFRIQMAKFQSYRAALKSEYTL